MEKKQIFIDKGTEVKRNSQYNTKALSGNYDKENLTKNRILQPYYVSKYSKNKNTVIKSFNFWCLNQH